MTAIQVQQRDAPASWCDGVIHPLFKAGDGNDPGNYGGIIAGVILAKLYAMFLEARATIWAEDRRCRAQGQTGPDRTFVQQINFQSFACHCNNSSTTSTALRISNMHSMLLQGLPFWQVLGRHGLPGRVHSSLSSR